MARAFAQLGQNLKTTVRLCGVKVRLQGHYTAVRERSNSLTLQRKDAPHTVITVTIKAPRRGKAK
jgi:hypothetical protein